MKISFSKIGTILTFIIVAILLSYQGGIVNGGSSTEVATGPVIGIDLGTTYSVVSIYRNGVNEIIPNDQGHLITPSIVAFTQYDRLIGDSAYNQMQSNPSNTLFDAKRLIGRQYDDPTIQHDMELWPFQVIKNSNNLPEFKVSYKNETHLFKPEQISGMVLSKMKQIAERYLGEPVSNAVITVPAYFNDNQRIATKMAGQLAGLNVLRIINEPTAASIAYGLNNHHPNTNNDNKDNSEKNIIVYDLGGGTFDVSLLTLDDGVFEVIATNGDTHLGGQDFDENIINYFIKKFESKYGIDLKSEQYTRGLNKLRKECEKAKRALSSVDTKQIKIEIDNIVNDIDFSETLSQAKFESLNNKLFLKTLQPLEQVFKDSKIKKSDIDEIVMVGGSTRIPKIQEMVKKFFNGKQLNFGINPDEAVAQGAAIQASILSNHPSQSDSVDHVVIDTTPLSLGIETVGGVFSKIINKNEAIPTTKSKIFSTYQDNQQTVTIKVYQGERVMTQDNIFLGNFNLNEIEPAPRGVPQIDIIFNIDADGIINIQAKDKNRPMNVKELTIDQDSAHPTQSQIDDMLKSARMFEEDDKVLMEKIEIKNQMEANVYQVKGQYGESSEEINELCEQMIDWLDGNSNVASLDLDDLKEMKQEFDENIASLIENLNGNGAASGYDDQFDHEEL